VKIIYCDSVFDNKIIEPDYEAEKISAIENGFNISLISFEELNDGNLPKALQYIQKSEKVEIGIYRGWMLEPKKYENLYKSLLSKNIQLINSPKEYEHCHYLPNSYDKIISISPKSNWTMENEEISENLINSLTNEFKESPIIVKDYVKSEKHNWENACFIPNASDKKNVNRIVSNFIELRGNSLNVGLVFREFEKLEFLTNHSKSEMPLTKEFRIVFLNNELVSIFDYWDEGEYGETKPNIENFKKIAKTIESNFFTMDVAKKENGEWIIMELGDGQVAGLPENANKTKYYENIKNALQQSV
jgi:hypothetical protein